VTNIQKKGVRIMFVIHSLKYFLSKKMFKFYYYIVFELPSLLFFGIFEKPLSNMIEIKFKRLPNFSPLRIWATSTNQV